MDSIAKNHLMFFLLDLPNELDEEELASQVKALLSTAEILDSHRGRQ